MLNASDLAGWPRPFVEACLELGLLVKAERGAHAPCPNCDGRHDVEVVAAWRENADARLIGTCPDTGLVTFAPEDVQRWRVSLSGFVGLIRRGLKIQREPEALSARAWSLGYAVAHGRVVRVVVADRFDPQWAGSKDCVFVACPDEHDEPQDSDAATRPIALSDVLDWSVSAGITFDPDVLASLPGHVVRGQLPTQGFVSPDRLIVNGCVHRCRNLTPLETDVLKRVAPRDETPITELVSDSDDAIWRERWNPKNRRLIGRIRTTFNALKTKLMQASPPAPFYYSFSARHGVIRRKSRK